jgi:predicted GNAT family N-acyltransferase
MSQAITIKRIENEADLFQALAIREVVFIEEQSVPESMERDEEDASAFHVLAFEDKHAVATGRLVGLSTAPKGETGHWCRIGRMAVLQGSRKSGIGGQVLTALEVEARKRSYAGVLLHAQVAAKGFYQKFGYEPFGPIFDEAGMPHLEMKKMLK